MGKPVELFTITAAGMTWRYTSADEAITYSGQTYTPAAIERSAIKYTADLEPSGCTITVAALEEPVAQYLTRNPVDEVAVEIIRTDREDPDGQAVTLFSGFIAKVNLQGVGAQVECAGIERLLSAPIPRHRFSETCAWSLFSEECGLDAADYATEASVSVSADGLILTATEFAAYSDGYFTLGKVIWSGQTRLIADHNGETIQLAYAFVGLESGETVAAYPGCDGRHVTCRYKFNNVTNGLWFPFVPRFNPALRTP